MTEAHCTTVHQSYAECTCGWRSARVFWDAERLATWHRLAVGETIHNPYLSAFLAPVTDEEVTALGSYGSAYLATLMRRDRLVAEYAWAIPTESVVRRLAALSPICDLGCGTGYWAKLLGDVGAKVLAVDVSPPLDGGNHWHCQFAGILRQQVTLRHFVDILQGDAAAFDVPPDHALMLCWPPHSYDMAARALARYRGDRVIYVGEHGGCTGDDEFHEELATRWDLDARYEIPQWDGLRDDARVYVRRSS